MSFNSLVIKKTLDIDTIYDISFDGTQLIYGNQAEISNEKTIDVLTWQSESQSWSSDAVLGDFNSGYFSEKKQARFSEKGTYLTVIDLGERDNSNSPIASTVHLYKINFELGNPVLQASYGNS